MILRFCGSTDEYCLPCHGCQSGCSSGSSCPVASPTSTPTPTPAPSLTTGQKDGLIVGTLLLTALLAVLVFFCYKVHTKSQSSRATFTVEFPPGTAGAHLLRQIAGNGNRPFLPAPPNRTYNPYDRGRGRIYDTPSYPASPVSTLPA